MRAAGAAEAAGPRQSEDEGRLASARQSLESRMGSGRPAVAEFVKVWREREARTSMERYEAWRAEHRGDEEDERMVRKRLRARGESERKGRVIE